MSVKYAVGDVLSDTISPRAAFTNLDCSVTERTNDMSISNKTDWAIEIAFMQALDQSGQIPNGYIADTGTFVAGANLGAGESVAIDPCGVGGGAPKLIQATRLKASVKLKSPEGNEQTLYLDDIVAAAGEYFNSAGWEISYSSNVTHSVRGARVIETLKK